MKLLAIAALLAVALVQPQAVTGQNVENTLTVRVASGWFSRRFSYLVKVRVGGTAHQTRAVRNSDPYWNQYFYFPTPPSSVIIIEVYDATNRDARNSPSLMGLCFTNARAGAVNQLYRCNINSPRAQGHVIIYYTC